MYNFTPFQRRYSTYIKRCDEIERKLRVLETYLNNYKIKIDVF